MKSKLDTVANIAIIVLCVTAVAALANSQLKANNSGGFYPIEKGDTLKPVRSLLPAGADLTVLVALSPDCGFCTQSLPFYQRLDEELKKKSSVGWLAAVGDQDFLDTERQILEASNIEVDDIVLLDFEALKMIGTPTLLLLDEKARVLDVWVGKLKPDAEQEVLRAVDELRA